MAASARVRRRDAWEAGLPEAVQWQAYDMFLRQPWYETARWLKDAHGVEHCSRSSMYAWAAHMRERERPERLRAAVEQAAEIRAMAEKAGDLSDAVCAALQHLALDAVASRDPGRVKDLVGLALRARAESRADRETDAKLRRLAMLEDQAAKAADAKGKLAQAAASGGLSPEMRRQIEEAMGLL